MPYTDIFAFTHTHVHTYRHTCHTHVHTGIYATHIGTYVAHTNIFSHTHTEKKKRLAGGTVHRSPWPPLKSFPQRLWELRKILNIRQS